jgi:transposase
MAGELMMARSLARFSEGILNCCRHNIATAGLDGLNAEVKALIRRACGFRNISNLMYMILGIKEFNPLKPPAPG